ncbi:hypothetical protein DESC_70077 [Desulfosarcina cetonica]|nr:hypothetical protein DESC_70077 [Desulfosarcina cetonica]
MMAAALKHRPATKAVNRLGTISNTTTIGTARMRNSVNVLGWVRSALIRFFSMGFHSGDRTEVKLFFGFFPVGEKGLDPLVGQGMGGQLAQHIEGNRGDIRAHQRRIQDMQRITDAGHDDFRVEAVVVEDFDDLLDKLHAVLRKVVQAAHKGAHIGGAGLGRHQGLQG